MKNTTNYLLNKPDFTDFADIEKLNDNFDIIDTKIKEVEEKAGNIDLSGLQTQIDSKADKTHKHAISDVTNLQYTLDSKATKAHLDAHLDNKSNPHQVTSEQVNHISSKLVTDTPASYPTGISIFGLSQDETVVWRNVADSNLSTVTTFALVETIVGMTTFGSNFRYVQRVTFVYNSESSSHGTYEREGYGGKWQPFKKVLNSKDVVNDLVTENDKKPLSASQGKVLNETINTHLGEIATSTKLGHVKAVTEKDGTLILPKSKIMKSKVFDVPGTFNWIVPEGVTEVFLTGCAAGGGGASSGSYNRGTAGGITSFGSLLSLTGGSPAIAESNSTAGTGSGNGGGGSLGGTNGSLGYGLGCGGAGFTGGNSLNGGHGALGDGGSGFGYGSGGGAGDYVIDYPLNVTPGQSISIRIGKGGTGGTGGAGTGGAGTAGNGGNGLLIVKWFE